MEFILVDKAPEKLEKNEMALEKPNFKKHIADSKFRRGVKKLTTVNALRDVLMLITDDYDKDLNPYRINLSAYEGLAYENDDDLSAIIRKILNDSGIDLITKAVDVELKRRPSDVDTVYYISDDLAGEGAFIANGFTLKKTKSAKKDKKVTKNEETVV